MKLYFQHSDETLDYIAEVESDTNVYELISKDLCKRNPKYKVPYTRSWTDNNGWRWIDVGSWSEFYIIRGD